MRHTNSHGISTQNHIIRRSFFAAAKLTRKRQLAGVGALNGGELETAVVATRDDWTGETRSSTRIQRPSVERVERIATGGEIANSVLYRLNF
jgi:hypothetical protein